MKRIGIFMIAAAAALGVITSTTAFAATVSAPATGSIALWFGIVIIMLIVVGKAFFAGDRRSITGNQFDDSARSGRVVDRRGGTRSALAHGKNGFAKIISLPATVSGAAA